MGEIADMKIDGTLCEYCGVLIGDAIGYPRHCDDCKELEELDDE